MGPVPRDEQENLWQRFKLASDKVYEKRKGFIESFKSVLLENFEKKKAIMAEVQKYEDFDSEKITDWNKAATILMNFQKDWEAIGEMPREKSKEANKLFWGAFKKFFSKKRAFIQVFESEKDANLITKRDLIEQAQSLVDSGEDVWRWIILPGYRSRIHVNDPPQSGAGFPCIRAGAKGRGRHEHRRRHAHSRGDAPPVL